MAVRQGQVLKENIFAKLTGTPLIKFKAQKNWLYLIGTYKNKALLNYFFLSLVLSSSINSFACCIFDMLLL